MNVSTVVRAAFTAAALCSIVNLRAQNAAEGPSVGDLREEQRKIENAYLARGEMFVTRSKEQVTDNMLRPAKENGFYAVELLSRARKLLDKHPARIEEARGIFGRATESTREELRKSLREKIDPRYFNLQGKLEGLASVLAAKGDSSLQQALDAAKVGDTARVEQLMRQQGIRPQDSEAGPGTVMTPPPQPASGSLPNIPGGTAMQNGSNVNLMIPGVGSVSLPGTLSSDGRFIDSPEFGRIDLSTMRTLPDGTVVAKSDRGVVYLGKDGKWHLLAGARLNDDGTITTASGETGPVSRFAGGGMGGGGGGGGGGMDPRKFTGDAGDRTFIDAKTGKRIRVGPKWENGEQKAVATEYGDEEGGILLSETQVTRRLTEASGAEWKVVESPGQPRSWDLNLKKGDEKSSNGAISFTLGVSSSGGGGGFQIDSWQIVNARGDRANVNPSSGNEVLATFTKEGRYSIEARGKTDWGTPFRVKGETSVNP